MPELDGVQYPYTIKGIMAWRKAKKAKKGDKSSAKEDYIDAQTKNGKVEKAPDEVVESSAKAEEAPARKSSVVGEKIFRKRMERERNDSFERMEERRAKKRHDDAVKAGRKKRMSKMPEMEPPSKVPSKKSPEFRKAREPFEEERKMSKGTAPSNRVVGRIKGEPQFERDLPIVPSKKYYETTPKMTSTSVKVENSVPKKKKYKFEKKLAPTSGYGIGM